MVCCTSPTSRLIFRYCGIVDSITISQLSCSLFYDIKYLILTPLYKLILGIKITNAHRFKAFRLIIAIHVHAFSQPSSKLCGIIILYKRLQIAAARRSSLDGRFLPGFATEATRRCVPVSEMWKYRCLGTGKASLSPRF